MCLRCVFWLWKHSLALHADKINWFLGVRPRERSVRHTGLQVSPFMTHWPEIKVLFCSLVARVLKVPHVLRIRALCFPQNEVTLLFKSDSVVLWHWPSFTLSLRYHSCYVGCAELQGEAQSPVSPKEVSSEEEPQEHFHHHEVALCNTVPELTSWLRACTGRCDE